MAENTLYFGDNLKILRDNIRDETIDLIYLDPPFNSKANYNVLFRSPKGHESHAQITAFEDTWHWGEQAEAKVQSYSIIRMIGVRRNAQRHVILRDNLNEYLLGFHNKKSKVRSD